MDGVKVTYIETSFVTSDAAGFKDLVQRLTGRSPAGAGADCRRNATAAASAAAGPQPQGCYQESPPAAHGPGVGDGRLAPPCLELDDTYGVADFSDQSAQYCGHGGYYSDFFPC